MANKEVKIIGAGLAGCEAAWQLAQRDIHVKLYEQKPLKKHEAFKSDIFPELICSNSLRSNNPLNAVGLLKDELRVFDSLIMEAADKNQVEAGSSLAVDRDNFSNFIYQKITEHPHIEIINEEVKDFNEDDYLIISAGPLLEGKLAQNLLKFCDQDSLYFYDAIAPIIEKNSIDFDKVYYKSRYDEEGEGAYINCPLTRDEFFNFYTELINAKTIDLKEIDKEIFFEGCLPIEEMAKRGMKTLLFGPLKPVGLEINGQKPYAVVQLRKDNAIDSLYNMVGFQTHLTISEQKRVFSLIPGLENCHFMRYGQMHRNTYLNSTQHLNNHYAFRKKENIFIAGQLSGVEGYIESTASGCYAALCMYQYLNNQEIKELSRKTMMGAMASYISNHTIKKLVPMNANFGIMQEDIEQKGKNRKQLRVDNALAEVKRFKEML